jgi:hypothetical protein
MGDPVIRTSHDAAKHILDALEAAGHRPSRRKPACLGFNGDSRHPNWDEITQSLAALGTAAQTVELIGRSAVDDIHGQRLVEMFSNLAQDIRDEVERLNEELSPILGDGVIGQAAAASG